MPLSSWVEVVVGLFLVGTGLIAVTFRTLPGPAWIWGVRDTGIGVALPVIRASGTGSIALGGYFLDEAWFFAVPHDPRVTAAALALGVGFLGCAIGFNVRSLRLQRAGVGRRTR